MQESNIHLSIDNNDVHTDDDVLLLASEASQHSRMMGTIFIFSIYIYIYNNNNNNNNNDNNFRDN